MQRIISQGNDDNEENKDLAVMNYGLDPIQWSNGINQSKNACSSKRMSIKLPMMESERRPKTTAHQSVRRMPSEQRVSRPPTHMSWLYPSHENIDNHCLTNQNDIMYIKKQSQFQGLLEEKRDLSSDPRFRAQKRVYRKMRFPRYLAMSLYIILTFFQKPSWCEDGVGRYSDDCTMDLITNQTYYLSPLPYLHPTLFSILQLILVVFLTGNKILRVSFNKKSWPRRIRLLFYMVCCVTCCLEIWSYEFTFINNLFSPIFMVLYYRYLRTEAITYFGYIYTSLPIIFLMVLNLVMFTLIGKFIFYQELMNKDFFHILFNLFVLQTTCNFPDVMMTSYTHQRSSFLFYMAFLCLNNIILTNMLIGVIYMNYKAFLQKQVKSFSNDPQLQRIFDEYIDSTDYKNKEVTGQIKRYFHTNERILLRKDSQLIKSRKNSANQDIIQRERILSGHTDEQMDTSQILSQEGLTMEIQQLEQELRSTIKIKQVLQCIQIMMSILNVSALVLLFVLYFDNQLIDRRVYYSQLDNIAHHTTELSLLHYMMTVHVLLMIDGLSSLVFIKEFSSIYHKLLVIAETLTSLSFCVCYCLFYSDYISLYVLHSLVLFRLIRLIAMILQIRVLRLIVNGMVKILPQFLDHLCVLFSLYFIFGAIGLKLFGGLLTKELAYHEYDLPSSYAANNFNDLPSGFVTCFELMIVNNWHVIAKTHSTFYQSRQVLFFFILFYHFAVLFGIQIIVAIIIEWMTQTLSYVKTQREKVEQEHTNSHTSMKQTPE